MNIRRRSFTVIGERPYGKRSVWCLKGPENTDMRLDYHPAFAKLYPPKSSFPCIMDPNSALPRYLPDWETIYSSIYSEGKEYPFHATKIEEDSKTFAKRIVLQDEYGFQFILNSPSKDDLRHTGSSITCRVTSVSMEGIEVESTSNKVEPSKRTKEADDALFKKLHDSRAASFRELNKRSMRGVWKSVIDKYPDTAHFIYELLQNADDAKATDVTILLGEDALVFKHNGTVHFSVSDEDDIDTPLGHINSITGIGFSTKDDNNSTNKIGKFGIGFKSVFQYTDTPEIFDDYYHFRIRDYIVPEELDYDHESREEGETLFYIPFKNPQAAFYDISGKLKELANVTLFLHNLTQIKWRILSTDETRTYGKSIVETFPTRKNILYEKLTLTNYKGKQDLLMFSREVDFKEDGKHRIYVGYYLRKDGTIDTEIRPKVHCFFPTSETFDMCMIMHAPFLLVDNRQQIKPREKTNERLINELGRLAADTLTELRELGRRDDKFLLNENVAEIVQWDDYDSYVHEYGRRDESVIEADAIINPCIEKLRNANLILSADNKYYRLGDIYHVFPESLADLITAEQLKQLRRAKNQIGILCPALNKLNSNDFGSDIGLNEYTTINFASDITPQFMAEQSMQWVNRLFAFLNNEVKKTWLPEEKNPFFLKAPIIQTTNGEWVPPFLKGNINVYLDGNPEEYNIVSKALRASNQAERFLKDIGCKAPDQLDYIITHILGEYGEGKKEYSADQLVSDLIVVLRYYYSAPLESKEKMMEKARGKILIASLCEGKKGNFAVAPSDLYLDTPDLKLYFKGVPDVYFFDPKYYKDVLREFSRDKIDAFLTDLGARVLPKVYTPQRVYKFNLTERQRQQIKIETNTTYETILDKQIDGLPRAVENPSKACSHAIWNLVSKIDLSEYRTGIFKYTYYKDYKKDFESSAIETLRNNAWINVKGKRYVPSKVSLEQFAEEGYEIHYELCTLLGIRKKEIDLAAAGASKDQVRWCEIGKKFEEAGYSVKNVDEVIAILDEKNAAQKKKEKEEAKNDFLSTEREALKPVDADMFGSTTAPQTQKQTDDIRAEKRREKLQEQKDKVMNDLQRNEDLEDIRESVKDEDKYSKEWFEKLLTLEYKSDSPKDSRGNSKAISISFGKVLRDKNSERILVLRNPSQPIPLEIETIDRLEVKFEFQDQEEKLIIFEVASVRDFTLRLKAKAADKALIEKTDWTKCTRAVVNANNPTELMGKLIDAFRGLEVEDGFNFKENLQDNVSFVFGPPGTGKTTYVSKRICEIMKTEPNCRILVLAPTNKACDVITERIASIANNPRWLGRFVATGSEVIEQNGLLCNRDSGLYEEDQCCLVSTIARLPYDGFVSQGGAPRLRDLDWEYVVIDEASMIPIAQIVYAIYRFSPYAKIIVSGDPLQIPPIANEELWAEENIYTMVNLNRFDKPATEPIQFEITNLTTQFRSVPAIGEIFSRYSYAGLLKHHRSQNEQRAIKLPGLPMKSVNFIQFKVEKYDNIFGAKKLAGSNVQIYSVLLVTELCSFIAKKYKGKETINVGVICPYVAESQMIERLIEQQEGIPENITFNVGTIHGFQGDECDIVFVVFNPPKAMASQPDRIMLNRKHIVNVAISRAKDYLFLLIPHPQTEGFQNLYEIKRLGKIASSSVKEQIQYFTSDDIEQILFGKKFFLENNTFVTSHQMANVYSEPGMKYEVRIDENSVDVQISD